MTFVAARRSLVTMALCAVPQLGCGSEPSEEQATPAPTTGPAGAPTPSDPAPSDPAPSDPAPSASPPGASSPSASSPSEQPAPSASPSEAQMPELPTDPLSYNRCPDDVMVGDLALVLAKEYTAFSGSVADGVVPGAIPELIASSGDCRLLTTPNLTCEGCNVVTETCSPTGCIPYPESIDAGTISVTGLESELMMTPSGGSKRYSNPTGFPHPGFQPGAAITLHAAGSDTVAAFSLRGFGVSALEVADAPVPIAAGVPAVVSWTAPSTNGPTKISLTLNVNHHGSTSQWISCETEDTGNLEIPAELIDELLARGFSGWPTIEMRRQSSDSTMTSLGCVDFFVQSPVVLDVLVEGLVSCSDDEDCPEGQSCRQDQSCG